MARMKSATPLTEEQQARLDAEFASLMASREALNIALRKEQPPTYRQALNFGAVIAPSILSPHRRILRGIKESEEARLIREQAAAESVRTGRTITPLEYIESEIQKREEQIEAFPDGPLMKGRLKLLKKIRQEIRPKNYTESQLIIRDAMKVERSLPYSGEGTEYKEYELEDDRVLRIRVLHPDPPESKIGADLVYEFHDLEEETVRLAFIQYKLWNGRTMPQDPRMLEQLERLRTIGCKGALCSPAQMNGKPPYRFPHCAMFLRPTDRLQSPDAKLISSGLHVPLCVADSCWVVNNRGGNSIRRDDLLGQSVAHNIFEDLFHSNLLGSGKIPAAKLVELYRDTGVLESDEAIIFHAQEYVAEPVKPKARKRSRSAG